MKTQTKINYLEKARDLIADKDNWCQGHSAVDENGELLNPKNSNAMRFCAMGAVERVVRRSASTYSNISTLEDLLDNECNDSVLARSAGRDCIVGVNDHNSGHAHRSVISVFNRTIKKLQKGK